jgi:two-component system OmpR family sensor kinase
MMAVVLGATGLFLYLRFEHQLDDEINQGLRSRAGDVEALVMEEDAGLRQADRTRLAEQSESFAQVVDVRVRVFDATPKLRRRVLLTAPERRRAEQGPLFLDKGHVPGLDRASRILAAPIRVHDRRLIVVVGASTEDRNDALRNLRVLLMIGGPAALLLALAAGYGVASAALRPVESMRRRAAAVSASESGQRLPVPKAHDEVSRLGETLNEMLQRLELALARERAYVADASHELRTPLSMLRTELELASKAGRSREELEAAVRSAAEETDRLAQLAEDLLVLARSDQGRLPVRLEQADVERIFSGVAHRFGMRGRQQDRQIEREVVQKTRLMADPLRLEQALGNLVDNALRYGDGPIRLTAVEWDGFIELHVTDRGPGFSPEFLSNAFARFTRADGARTSGGAGLGLSIVEVIAHAHGGTARAANREGGGADVWISLPAKPA